MTAEEAKNIDTNRIEYIVLSSGERVYIKKPEEKNPQKEKDQTGFEELKQNVIEKETKQEILKVTQNIIDQNQELIEKNQEKFQKNQEILEENEKVIEKNIEVIWLKMKSC